MTAAAAYSVHNNDQPILLHTVCLIWSIHGPAVNILWFSPDSEREGVFIFQIYIIRQKQNLIQISIKLARSAFEKLLPKKLWRTIFSIVFNALLIEWKRQPFLYLKCSPTFAQQMLHGEDAMRKQHANTYLLEHSGGVIKTQLTYEYSCQHVPGSWEGVHDGENDVEEHLPSWPPPKELQCVVYIHFCFSFPS